MPKDELTIERRARVAAEAATRRISKEAWAAARRLGEMSDQLRLVPQQFVERIAEQFRQANHRVNELLGSVTRPVLEAVDVFRSPEIQDLIMHAQEAFARLPAAMRDALHTLGMNGWYPDDEMDMAELVGFAKGFEAGEEHKTNEALCQHFEARSEAIVNDLAVMVPTRERFLRAALQAHRDQKCKLSIPLLLAQADGMWRDFTKADKKTRLYSRS